MKIPISLIIILFCLSGKNLAQSFSNESDRLLGHAIHLRTMDVEIADLNQDGFQDIVLAVEWAPNAILWGNGKHFTQFTPQYLSKNQFDSEEIVIVDLDNDGWLDLVFAAEDDQNHEVYKNLRNGHFEEIKNVFPKFTSNSIKSLDVNNDGKMDLIFGNAGQNRIFVNDGNFKFTDETHLRLPKDQSTTQDILVIDINNDKHFDLVLGNEFGNEIWINDGHGKFIDETKQRWISNPEMETRKVIAIDANRDGWIDLFTCNVDSENGKLNQDVLYLNDGFGNLIDTTNQGLIPNQSIDTLDAAVVDLNQDGYDDLVLTYMGKNKPNVLLNDGKGRFKLDVTLLPEVSGNNISIIAKDLNHDQKLDLYIGGFMTEDKLLYGK